MFVGADIADSWENAWRQSDWGLWLPPPGDLRESWARAGPVLDVPVHVLGHGGGKRVHHFGHWLWLPPAHSHVLLPGQPLLHRPLLCHQHNPQDVGEPSVPEQSHLVRGVSDPALLPGLLGDSGQPHPGHNGIWPLRGHLPPTPLRHSHEPWALHFAPHLMLGTCCLLWPHAHPPHDQGDFLWVPEDTLHLLWDVCPTEARMFQHSDHSHSADYHRHLYLPHSLWVHDGVLCPDCQSHPPNILSFQQIQSFLHLRFPLGCGLPLLWDPLYGVSAAHPNLLHEGLSSHSDVCGGDPHDEPFHLQPEEKGHAWGSGKAVSRERLSEVDIRAIL